MRANVLKLNPDKTHLLTVGTMARLGNLSENVKVSMNDTILKEDQTKSEFLLGCYVDCDMKWKYK